MAIINFLYPNFLWFLFLIPVFIFVYFFSLIYDKKRSVIFANFQAVERFYGIEFFSKNFIALYLNLIVLILIVLSISGMSANFKIDTSSNSFVILLDNSKSMTADDIEPTRFDAAKDFAKNFIDGLPLGVNIGVISFSGSATIYQELDSVKYKSRMGIDTIEFGAVEGTNVYNALMAAEKLFTKKSDAKGRVVILISDGQANVGDIDQIISFAERNKIVVNTIGVGTGEGGVTNMNVISKIDIDFLKALAFNTNGMFFRVEDTQDFEQSYNLLMDKANEKVSINISTYLLVIAIIIFSINWILFNMRFKTFP